MSADCLATVSGCRPEHQPTTRRHHLTPTDGVPITGSFRFASAGVTCLMKQEPNQRCFWGKFLFLLLFALSHGQNRILVTICLHET